MIDIDYFKKYNDTYGHGEGDTCLKTVAQTLSECVTRESDFVARYGGEEFTIVLPYIDEHGAHIVAEKLLKAVRAHKIPHESSYVSEYVTVSVGATTGRVCFGQTAEEYLKRADEGLYISKNNGRNKYTFVEFETRQIHKGDAAKKTAH